MYATKKNRLKGYLDMNILFDEFYKSDDFIKESGGSLLEEYANKIGIGVPKTIKYPKFNVQTTNALADMVNCFLQYIYTQDKNKKLLSLKKMNKIMDKVDISSQEDFEKLQNTLIRFLLRNIYFYESCRRKRESDLVLSNRDIEVPSFALLNNSFGEALRVIVNDKEYYNILQSIQNSNDRKKDISQILKYYK